MMMFKTNETDVNLDSDDAQTKSEMIARGQSILVDTLSTHFPNDSSRAIAKSNPKGKVVLMQILAGF